jgi:PII-like signaling protein
MNDIREAKLLRIFISNTDMFRHTPLYEAIVFAAKRYDMAGATVLKGVMGFGQSSTIRSIKFWEVTEKLPMVIEIMDEAEKVENFAEIILPYFDKLKNGCIMTIEKANIILYKTGDKK